MAAQFSQKPKSIDTKMFLPLKWLSWLAQACQSIFAILVAEDKTIIEEQIDDDGNTYWKIYDPVTDETRYCLSEQELLLWYQGHRDISEFQRQEAISPSPLKKGGGKRQ